MSWKCAHCGSTEHHGRDCPDRPENPGVVAVLAPGVETPSSSAPIMCSEAGWLDAKIWVPPNARPVLAATQGNVEVMSYQQGLGWGDDLDGYIVDPEHEPQWWMPVPPLPATVAKP